MLQNNQQITIPSFPPPTIVQNNGLIQSQPALIQQQNFIQQAPPTILQQQPTANAIQIQQQPTTLIPHSVPMQIIQQTPITIPPPTIPIRTAQNIVQLQQQPANIQIQANGQPAQVDFIKNIVKLRT